MKPTPIVTVSGTHGTQQCAFPFLRLPIELRLVVYEFLFASITRTHYELESMSTSPRALHACLVQKYNKPAASIVFVYEEPPVAVLATCHQVYSEAIVFARPAIKALKQRPRKMIVTTGAMDCDLLEKFIQLCRSTKDTRRLIEGSYGPRDWHVERTGETRPDLPTTQVQVAIRNEFENRPFGDHGTTEDLWSYFRMYMMRLHYDKLLYEAHELRLQEQRWPTHNVDITFRMALMSPVERQEFEAEPWFENSITNDGNFLLQIKGGEEIESAEWEEDWTTSVPACETVMNEAEGVQSSLADWEEGWIVYSTTPEDVDTSFKQPERELIQWHKGMSKGDGFFHTVSGWWKVICGRWSGREWLD